MERVRNNDMQPIPLDGGTVLAAAGTKEAGPREVELSARDRKLYVDTGRITILKPTARATETIAAPTAPLQSPATDKSTKAGK
jgi:hypothetical protein